MWKQPAIDSGWSGNPFRGGVSSFNFQRILQIKRCNKSPPPPWIAFLIKQFRLYLQSWSLWPSRVRKMWCSTFKKDRGKTSKRLNLKGQAERNGRKMRPNWALFCILRVVALPNVTKIPFQDDGSKQAAEIFCEASREHESEKKPKSNCIRWHSKIKNFSVSSFLRFGSINYWIDPFAIFIFWQKVLLKRRREWNKSVLAYKHED